MFKRVLRGSYQFLPRWQVKPGQIIFYVKTGQHYKVQSTKFTELGRITVFGTVAFGRNAGQPRYLTDSPCRVETYFYEEKGKLHWSNIPPSPGDVIYVGGQRVTVVEYTDSNNYYCFCGDTGGPYGFFSKELHKVNSKYYPVLKSRR